MQICTACGFRGRQYAPICNESSHHQLHFVYDRLHGICAFSEERLLKATIWSFLLGAYDFDADRGVEVMMISAMTIAYSRYPPF